MRKPTLPVFIFGVLLGGVLGAVAVGMPWAEVFKIGCKVTVVNVSGEPLENVSIVAGESRRDVPSLGAGLDTSAVLQPVDTRELVVTFDCNGQRYSATAGGIDQGERRTVTVLEDGTQVIVSYGTADAVADLKPTERLLPQGSH